MHQLFAKQVWLRVEIISLKLLLDISQHIKIFLIPIYALLTEKRYETQWTFSRFQNNWNSIMIIDFRRKKENEIVNLPEFHLISDQENITWINFEFDHRNKVLRFFGNINFDIKNNLYEKHRYSSVEQKHFLLII
jgi:hypothetical protein